MITLCLLVKRTCLLVRRISLSVKNKVNKQLLQQKRAAQQQTLNKEKNAALELKFQFKYLSLRQKVRYYLERGTIVAGLAPLELYQEVQAEMDEENMNPN